MEMHIGLIITLIMYIIFFTFQSLYIFIPLLTVKGPRFSGKENTFEQGISVLIPAYNEESVLKNCIQAMLHVDYQKYEAFIINDGSSDKGGKIQPMCAVVICQFL